MSIIEKAIKFAVEKHSEQTDKGGNAYILHPLRMMIRLSTSDEELMAIAVLHDVVEDCEVSSEDLRDIGMTERVIAGVNSLTRKYGENYNQFIDRLALNKDAILVKIEDLLDNLDLTRIKEVSEKDVRRTHKYMLALKGLEVLLDS